MNVGIDDKVDFTKPDVKKRLLKAQVVFENGSNPYPDELYEQAVAMSMDKVTIHLTLLDVKSQQLVAQLHDPQRQHAHLSMIL